MKNLTIRGLAIAMAVGFLALVATFPIAAEKPSAASIGVNTQVVDYSTYRNAEPEYWADVEITIDQRDADGEEALQLLHKFYVAKGRFVDAEKLRAAIYQRRQKWESTHVDEVKEPVQPAPIYRVL